MIPGAPENKRMEQPIDPISPFHIENKMGFAPKLHCICGASIDTKEGRLAIERFKLAHEECLPLVSADTSSVTELAKEHISVDKR